MPLLTLLSCKTITFSSLCLLLCYLQRSLHCLFNFSANGIARLMLDSQTFSDLYTLWKKKAYNDAYFLKKENNDHHNKKGCGSQSVAHNQICQIKWILIFCYCKESHGIHHNLCIKTNKHLLKNSKFKITTTFLTTSLNNVFDPSA